MLFNVLAVHVLYCRGTDTCAAVVAIQCADVPALVMRFVCAAVDYAWSIVAFVSEPNKNNVNFHSMTKRVFFFKHTKKFDQVDL